MHERKICLFDAPTQDRIAHAVRDIILSVKRDQHVTNAQLAAMLEVDAKTVQRLEDMETAKVPASVITAIGHYYGEEYVQPYMRLFRCKAVKEHCEEAVNALPALTALAAKIAAAVRLGQADINHQALAGMLAELREVDGVVSSLRARASDLGLAA